VGYIYEKRARSFGSITRVIKRFSKIRLSKLFIVLVFDLQKSNIVSNTVQLY